ncbi:MAG: hypothetical protein CVU61_13180 [Deltaproteobacteria bacterium HGW-Deltaproteobacteria-19]|nr:MAG: hypothetical protein CVU61_13180 [Deltaproteobacteria bacterium HGW-Deltaproteobacteria-19]
MRGGENVKDQTDRREQMETLRKNKEIARKYARIGEALPACGDEGKLFETLVTGVREAFEIPYVWISLTDTPEALDLLVKLRQAPALKDVLNVVRLETLQELLGDGTAPVLANEGLKPFYRLLPRRRKFFFKSIVMAPLILKGRAVGSLNSADPSPTRYHPGMDTGLLEQLMATVSRCLEEKQSAGTEAVPES